MNRITLIILLLIPIYLIADVDLNELNDKSLWVKKIEGDVIYYTKKDYKKVPVLCFHKIGAEDRYEITSKKFEEFLIYLNKNNFYALSDKEMILKDFSKVPSGFTPIVLGSDDASEGNFEYKTINNDRVNGEIDISTGKMEHYEDTMVYLLEKYLKPENERINFTFYIAFDDVPFRQTGGQDPTGQYYRGLDILESKFKYLLDHFIVGIHTVTHRITKNISVEDFKWELDTFFDIMEDYTGDRIGMINTLAYPYGCADLNPELRKLILEYNYKNLNILGAFDFDGYFSKSPYSGKFDNLEISRLGVDNQNIQNVYGFLENVPLYVSERVLVVNSKDDLFGLHINDDDQIIIGEL